MTADAAPKCPHCGSMPHSGVCPSVKAIEYYPDGTVKRVEYKGAGDYVPVTTDPVQFPFITRTFSVSYAGGPCMSFN